MVKCKDSLCCKETRSSLRVVLRGGFLPIPFPLIQGPNGLIIPKPNEHNVKNFASFLLRQSLRIVSPYDRFRKLPYAMHCPSLQSTSALMAGRICNECGLYFCSKKAVTIHKTSLHKKKTKKTIDNRPVTEAENDENDTNDIHDADIDQLKGNKLINEDSIAFVSIQKSHENPWIDDD